MSLPSVSTLRRSETQNSGTPIARTRGDCDHTWRERRWSGCAAFGVFKRLWQRCALENKVHLWSILRCVIRRFLCS